jgi:hypothetical protein
VAVAVVKMFHDNRLLILIQDIMEIHGTQSSHMIPILPWKIVISPWKIAILPWKIGIL